MKFDLYFYEAFAEEQSALERTLGPNIRVGYSADTIQRSGHPAPPAPIISIRTQSVVPADWHPPITAILARTTGYDHLQPILARANPPHLAHLPEYCSRAVAEQAALLWMALLRRLPQQQRQWPRFNRDDLTGGENLGRTLLVAGVGRIGHEIVQIGRGLGMKVLGVDPVARLEDVKYVSLEDGIANADVVVASMNLTERNRGLFTYDRLRNAKPGALFINVARGELAVASDLLRLLDEGVLGGVGLDVYDGETAVADALRNGGAHPEADTLRNLARHPRVILTPHNAFNTVEALARKAEYSAQQVMHFMKTGRFKWPFPSA